MDSFDYFLIVLGVILIAIGLFLFIAGKTDSKVANQLEGFGIKINVSNPSVLLIVMGIGLVLIPRLLPSNAATGTQTETKISQNTNVGQESTKNQPKNQDVTNVVTTEPVVEERNQPEQRKYFPDGQWTLVQVEENGVDLSYMITGNATFSKRSHDMQSFRFQTQSVDMWGNPLVFTYQGYIRATNSGYVIETESSNDPTFIRRPPVNLIMKIDPSGWLHIEYVVDATRVILHFAQ